MSQRNDNKVKNSTPDDHHTGAWATSPTRDLTGKTIGDFEVERLLGFGGMGEVYLGRQISLNRPVALKVLKPDMVSNPTYLARFESEAWAAARLNHANVVHIYTLGAVDSIHFIAMEYIQGINLREYLSKKGVPDLALALAIMRQAGMAIGAAGEIGLVHRDIKPDNLMITRKGQVKVADFGLCRGPDSDKMNLTQVGNTVGTPMYMSPEQVQGLNLDHRSDLYSLGVTFYHMLAEFPPFRAESSLALALKHVREEPVDLAVHRPDLPRELTRLVMKLMAKDPSKRYQTAEEMLRDLSKVKESIQASSASQADLQFSIASQPAQTAPQLTASSIGRSAGWRRLKSLRLSRTTVFALSVLSLAAGAAGGWLSRVENVLSTNATRPKTAPGLWMADWPSITRQPTAEAQYRFAQMHVPFAELEAAWLAVPGYFPDNAEWNFRAYVQLARHFFRRNDADRLRSLSEELGESQDVNSPYREKWQTFSKVVRAAYEAVRGQSEAVADQIQYTPIMERSEPDVLELSYEIVLKAQQTPDAQGTPVAKRLQRLRTELMRSLVVESF